MVFRKRKYKEKYHEKEWFKVIDPEDQSDFRRLSKEKKLAKLEERYKEGKVSEHIYMELKKKIEAE